jgi:predicted nucleic acid-binding protein
VILVDTSVWVEYFRGRCATLVDLLEEGKVLCHPFIVGELALGRLEQRDRILRDLSDLPQATVASHDEVLHFIEECRLFAEGIGYVDAHLLAAARITHGAALWTRDTRLRRAANSMELAAKLP